MNTRKENQVKRTIGEQHARQSVNDGAMKCSLCGCFLFWYFPGKVGERQKVRCAACGEEFERLDDTKGKEDILLRYRPTDLTWRKHESDGEVSTT